MAAIKLYLKASIFSRVEHPLNRNLNTPNSKSDTWKFWQMYSHISLVNRMQKIIQVFPALICKIIQKF